MRRAAHALVALLLATGTGLALDGDDDDDGDSAPFAVLVERGDGWRCLASLVSLRTALTSAWCARPRTIRELWARPAHAPSQARRVARVAYVPSAAAASEAESRGSGWLGVADDVAVLELEAPFGAAAHARPILMAMLPEECSAPRACHAVRAIRRRGVPVALRIVDISVVEDERCAERGPGWPALRASALCLAGASMDTGAWGAGIVCGGKLCGVLSCSVGEVHAAQAVPRWRRFLHCAHNLRACGSAGQCARQCAEERLLGAVGAVGEVEEAAPIPTRAATDATPPASFAPSPGSLDTREQPGSPRGSTSPSLKDGPTRSVAPASSPTETTPTPPFPRASIEFEPNRPDFKAGEYGDNGADYAGEEPPVGGAARGGASAIPTRSPLRVQGSPERSVAPDLWQMGESPGTPLANSGVASVPLLMPLTSTLCLIRK